MPDDVHWASNGAAELSKKAFQLLPQSIFRKRKTKWEKRYGVLQALVIAATPMSHEDDRRPAAAPCLRPPLALE